MVCTDADRSRKRSTSAKIVAAFGVITFRRGRVGACQQDGAHRQALLAKGGTYTSTCVCRGGLPTLVGMFRVVRCWAQHVRLVATSRATEGTHL
jgi:hypothetical protein